MQGQTAFSAPAEVSPSGPTHVSFYYCFCMGLRTRGRTGGMVTSNQH